MTQTGEPEAIDQEEPKLRHSEGSGRTSGAKMAEVLAAQIEAEIIEIGWPVGLVLGSEVELIKKYGVSRSVLREAVRLMEHHLVAEMRMGRNGGLVVTAPNADVVTEAVAGLLRFQKVAPRDLFETRRALELTCVKLAAERASEEEIEGLRKLAYPQETQDGEGIGTHSMSFHQGIAAFSGNPAMHLFVQVLTVLTERTVDLSAAEQHAEDVNHSHAAIAEAIAAGDSALAQRRMLRHFEAMAAAVEDLTR